MAMLEFIPSQRSTIARMAVMLDPDKENYYYAYSAWFTLEGYLHLGKFPLLPDNVVIIGKKNKKHKLND